MQKKHKTKKLSKKWKQNYLILLDNHYKIMSKELIYLKKKIINCQKIIGKMSLIKISKKYKEIKKKLSIIPILNHADRNVVASYKKWII